MIKVLIADDQELIRQSLKVVLSANKDIEVVGTVCNGNEVVESIRRYKPDVILMDVRMPEMDGVQCTKIIKESYPNIKIIVLTTFDDDEYIFNALKYGASGYLLKGVSMDELIKAIHTVVNGGAMINPDITAKVFKLFSQMAQGDVSVQAGAKKNLDDICDIEWDIIKCIGFGLSNKEIAKKLRLSEGTVRNYLSNILNKLNFRDRTQLAIWAVQTGVIRKMVTKK
ncbi:two component transcriptional regulator, LuxR family [Clostridium acidisoli DSM 12555]|uniref:Stage 0 sporulation protein A homolog n=1 Tax=Clostridium acidisoli DSM 12555 TaxID=1121291 RepID=A0A1W1XI02_9CLOT|nr:response regulator transcription factor [Clostridium acidisoli]SMC23412.1 two component transcriptional regulator, LuxR family [Clostridium acidisoli DSM 12555]